MDLPGDEMNMEKWVEWPARGRTAVSPFPGDILEPFRVHLQSEMEERKRETSHYLLFPFRCQFTLQHAHKKFVSRSLKTPSPQKARLKGG